MTPGREERSDEWPGTLQLDYAIRQIVSRAVASEGVVDIFAAAGLEKTDISILSEDELAFYDALETNDSAVQVLGDETLCDIARELVETVRNNIRIDWTLLENVRANLSRLVKRILRKHGYPPDMQEKATRTAHEQAEVLSAD